MPILIEKTLNKKFTFVFWKWGLFFLKKANPIFWIKLGQRLTESFSQLHVKNSRFFLLHLKKKTIGPRLTPAQSCRLSPTRAQHWSHTRHANSLCVQCFVMASAALTRDRILHYLPRQVKFYSLSFHVIDINRPFQRNKLLYYLERCLLPNTWASQRYKYLKHGGRETVASKKMTLGQVVPNFTGQVVSSKILRIFRWKL